jgi:hypothetical protein
VFIVVLVCFFHKEELYRYLLQYNYIGKVFLNTMKIYLVKESCGRAFSVEISETRNQVLSETETAKIQVSTLRPRLRL